jgi:hypothetical protein
MVAAAAGLLVRTWRNLTQQQTAGHDPPPLPTPTHSLSPFFFSPVQDRIKKAHHKINGQKKSMIKN